MDHKTLGEIFQGIYDRFDEMRPDKATEIGQAASAESEGNRIKALKGDKKQQGEHFDDMEVWEDIIRRIYMDLDGVMINSILVVGEYAIATNAWKARWRQCSQSVGW